MSCTDYTLVPCRDQVFDRLYDIWKETKAAADKSNDPEDPWKIDIWRKANTLQAVAQYWHSSTDAARKRAAMNLMKEGYAFYLTRKTDQSLWVDDFGWWAGFF